MAQLPAPGTHPGTWGDALNQFLEVAHNDDGTLQPSALTQAGGVQVAGDIGGTASAPVVAKLQGTAVNASGPAINQVLAYNGSQWVPATVTGGSSAGNATSSTPGLIQLDGDLGGTATLPQVVSTHLAVVTNPSASGTVNLDPTSTRVFSVTQTGNATYTFTGTSLASGTSYSFTLYLYQDATGGRTATWPGSVTWVGGTAPALSTAPSALNLLVFETIDGGSSWHGSLVSEAPSLPLTVPNGGTGGSSLGAYQVITGGVTSSSPVQAVSGTGTSGQVLTSNGAAALPSWQPSSGAVASVTAGDSSVVVGGTGTNPTVATGTLDVIALDHPPAADWSNNGKKITSVANGSAASDAAAFGQIPTSAGSIGGVLAANNLSDVTAAAARTNLGLGSAATQASSAFEPAGTAAALVPLTTKGDLLYENATPAPARLAVGSAGQVLGVSSGAPAWGMGITLLAATPAAGYTLVNSTGTIVSWTAPNDGALHRVFVPALLHTTSSETGGAITASWTLPDGTVQASTTICAAAQGSGVHLTQTFFFIQANTTITISQSSAMSAGAAIAWIELWGS